MSNIKRKLTTILAIDCVSFSKHMEQHEENTLSSLNKCRSIIDKYINSFNGKIFHTAGDSVIAEFQTPVESVKASIKFQKEIMLLNKETDISPKLSWRVGVHVDDVIMENNNVYGTGVNIAARLEAKCNPGQILISNVVEQQIRNKIDEVIYKAGELELKNISNQFDVFSILGQYEINHKVSEDLNRNRKLKFALLPFTNSSQDEDSGFLVDGIVEDLITEFSMMREFEILSRQTSANYKKTYENIKEFSKAFDLDFVVTGSIRASGKRVRINIELSDAKDDSIIWSNKFDRVLEDIFDVQDEIVRKISIALLGEIEINSLQRAKRKPTDNMTSYEYLLRGKEKHHLFNKEANAEALHYFDKAIAADKNNAQAYAWKCCTLGQAMFRGYLENPDTLMEEAKYNIEKALESNENDFECHRMLSAVYLSNHEYGMAEDHGQKAYKMVPNDPRVLAGYGEVLVRVGKVKQGLEMLNKAYDLDPIPQGQSTSDNRLRDLILGYFFNDDFEKIIELGQELRHCDERSYILILYAKEKLGKSFKDSNEYRNYKSKYSSAEWSNIIDRFHIPDHKINKNLLQFSKFI